MSDFELIHRVVLSSATPLRSERIQLTPLPEGTVLQVFGPAAHAGSLAHAAARAGLSLRANGPGQWYLVGDETTTRDVLAELTSGLPDGFTVVEQNHGRVRIAVEGDAVKAVLAKGTGVDLSQFEIGHATTTLIGHISAHISRTSADRFELMPLRSFAESLWHDLEKMAAEYVVVPSRP
ncbi:sarcosine oxidase subunit gamma [Mesorhizobium robiniae]|uniref:Sarcosine oxidase subunit gamma n=1 Tax=Mesorhizobium robiniae TaxID=559315 RepID=A0ABV2GQ11_9HYPH